MRHAQLSGLVKRSRGRTTIRVPGVGVASDLVRRDFGPPAPDRLWVADSSFSRLRKNLRSTRSSAVGVPGTPIHLRAPLRRRFRLAASASRRRCARLGSHGRA
jgi:hypothetical protein